MKQTDIDLKIPTNLTSCNITITYPNSSNILFNKPMTINNGYANFTIDKSNTKTIGTYSFYSDCGHGIFDVTYSGKSLNTGQAVLYIGFLALMVLIFFLNFIGMSYLPSKNERDEEGKIMSISYLKYFRNVLWMTGYFLFIAITFLASNIAFAYLGEEMFAQILFTIYQISFGLAPVVIIVWLIWIFASIFHDRRFQQLLNRGMFPGEQL